MIDPITKFMPGDQVRTILNQMIAQLNNLSATGGTGDYGAADYGGGEPNFTPQSGSGWAVDTNPAYERVWWYYSGAWH